MNRTYRANLHGACYPASMREPYFSPAYMRLLYRSLRLAPDEASAFFEGTTTAAETLLSPTPQLPFAEQMQLCRNALNLRSDGLGIRLGRQLQLAAHGALGTAMQNADNLAAALTLFSEFLPTRASFFRLQFTEHDNGCMLTIDTPELTVDLRAFFTESILSTIQHCVEFFTQAAMQPQHLQLAYAAPAWAHRYTEAFGIEPTFDAGRTTLHLTLNARLCVQHERDKLLFESAHARCQQEISSRHTVDEASRLLRFLEDNPGKLWSLAEVAKAIGVSRRTAARRLAQSGTRFQAIRDSVLKEHAQRMLAVQSVSDTAATLGFSDESSFRRSYRRWFGTSPGAYRRTVERR